MAAARTAARWSQVAVPPSIQVRLAGTIAAGDSVVEMIKDLQAAEGKIPEERLNEARELHRKAQWRLDFVLSENSRGFHASQEIARLLGESIDFSRQAQVKILKP